MTNTIRKYLVADAEGSIYCSFDTAKDRDEWLYQYQADCLAADGDDDCLTSLVKCESVTEIVNFELVPSP